MTWYGSRTGPAACTGGAAQGDHGFSSPWRRRRRRSRPAGSGRAAGRLLLDLLLEGGERLAGQDQVALLEDVVGVELGDRGDLDALDVAGAAVQDRVVGGQAEQDRAAVERPPPGLGLGLADGLGRLGLAQVGPADRPEGLGDLLGLGLARGPGRRATRAWPSWNLDSRAMRIGGPDGLLGHRVAVVAVAAGEGDAAALPLVGPLGAGAGVAGPLLAEELLARAGDVGPAAGVDRADPPRRQVHQHHVVQQLLVDLAAEIGRVDRLLADLLAGGVVDRYGQHGSIHFRSPIRLPTSVRFTPYWSAGWSGSRRWGRARPP